MLYYLWVLWRKMNLNDSGTRFICECDLCLILSFSKHLKFATIFYCVCVFVSDLKCNTFL